MLAIYRCAACGSPRVKADEKSEGYSIAKGVAGAVLLGGIGAAAGINGNKRMYYHCPDCGTTLSYPMSMEIVQIINMSVADPSKNISSLRNWKKSYPNIEWTDAETLPDEPRQISSFYDEDKLQSLSDKIPNINSLSVESVKRILIKKILKYPKITRCQKATADEIKRAIGYKKYNRKTDEVFFDAYSDAMEQLLDENELGVEKIDGTYRYIFYTRNEKKEHAISKLAKQTASEIFKKKGDLLCEVVIKSLQENTWITEGECKNNAVANIISSSNINDPLIVDNLYYSCIHQLQKDNDLITQTLEDGTLLYSRTSAEAKAKEEIKKNEAYLAELKGYSDVAINIKEQKILEAKRLMLFIENKLPLDERQYSEHDLIHIKNKDRAFGSAYSNKEFKELLYWAVYSDLLDYDGYSFALPGKRPKEDLKIVEIKKQLAEEVTDFSILQEKIMHYKAECQRLTGYLEEQRKIYSDNVGKIFGEGARKKKEAKQNCETTIQKMAACNNQLGELDKIISEKRRSIERLQQQVQDKEINLSPIDIVESKRTYNQKENKQEIIKYSDIEISIRREVLRVLEEENIPMCYRMIILKSDILKQFEASLGDRTLFGIVSHMQRDHLILPIDDSNILMCYIPLNK